MPFSRSIVPVRSFNAKSSERENIEMNQKKDGQSKLCPEPEDESSVASGSATTKFTDKFNSLFDKFSSQTAPSLGLKTAAKNVPSPKFYANVCQNHT
jgi:casein kinase II subunit alpha|tara:strand:+ start:164 stop:454 length:291 start_codon:yes stop_codon:yes gene_type:complete